MIGRTVRLGCTRIEAPSHDCDADDRPCLVCGKQVEDCLCPECTTCGMIGDPFCYKEHGLTRTQQQIDSLTEAEAQWEREAEEVEHYMHARFWP